MTHFAILEYFIHEYRNQKEHHYPKTPKLLRAINYVGCFPEPVERPGDNKKATRLKWYSRMYHICCSLVNYHYTHYQPIDRAAA